MSAPYSPGDQDEALEAMLARDRRLCLCDHKCISHGSFDSEGGQVGLGMAQCGISGCDCQRFAGVGEMTR